MHKVGIVMGSDSDLTVMSDAANILEKLGIEYEMRIISAHRTPEAAHSFAESAAKRGIGVIIAGAGAAAHLAGVIAAYTTLPVIGVPIKSQALSGLDSLYSIVQMPKGIPVACVAIGGAYNAGLLAAQILAVSDEALSAKLSGYKLEMAASVEAKDKELTEMGHKKYLEKFA